MKKEPFYLFIVDHDKKEFTEIGPMDDDTIWNDRVVKAQEQGRNINCSSFVTKNISKSIEEYKLQMNYKYTSHLII